MTRDEELRFGAARISEFMQGSDFCMAAGQWLLWLTAQLDLANNPALSQWTAQKLREIADVIEKDPCDPS